MVPGTSTWIGSLTTITSVAAVDVGGFDQPSKGVAETAGVHQLASRHQELGNLHEVLRPDVRERVVPASVGRVNRLGSHGIRECFTTCSDVR